MSTIRPTGGLGKSVSSHNYVALLRGIGPGNPNMRNDRLRAVLQSLGFSDVRTVISSGNVLFSAAETNEAKLEESIEEALQAQLGIPGGTIVRSRAELQKLVDSNPFGTLSHSRQSYLIVTFLKNKHSESPLPNKRSINITEREICSVINTTTQKTPNFMSQLEKQFGKEITTRTYQTIQRILAKF